MDCQESAHLLASVNVVSQGLTARDTALSDADSAVIVVRVVEEHAVRV